MRLHVKSKREKTKQKNELNRDGFVGTESEPTAAQGPGGGVRNRNKKEKKNKTNKSNKTRIDVLQFNKLRARTKCTPRGGCGGHGRLFGLGGLLPFPESSPLPRGHPARTAGPRARAPARRSRRGALPVFLSSSSELTALSRNRARQAYEAPKGPEDPLALLSGSGTTAGGATASLRGLSDAVVLTVCAPGRRGPEPARGTSHGNSREKHRATEEGPRELSRRSKPPPEKHTGPRAFAFGRVLGRGSLNASRRGDALTLGSARRPRVWSNTLTFRNAFPR